MWFSSESRQVARHFHVEQVLSHQNVRDRDASRTSGFGSADLSHSHHERHTSEETGAGRRQRNQRLKPSSPLRNHGDATTPTAHKGKKELVIFDSGMGGSGSPALHLSRPSGRHQTTRNFSSLALRTRLRVVGEAVSHRGGAQARRVETDKDARSAGGSHSVRQPSSTTTSADRRWPWRDTIVPLSSVSWWVPCVAG